MNWVTLLYAVSAVASALAAVLAWAAKLLWSKEYAAAKDEIIGAKQAQIELLKNEIENLRNLTPMKIREYFISVKEQLEEYIDSLQGQLDNAHAEIQEKDLAIANYESGIEVGGVVIQELRREKVLLSQKVTELETLIGKARVQKQESERGVDFTDDLSDLFARIAIAAEPASRADQLRRKIVEEIEKRMEPLAKEIAKTGRSDGAIVNTLTYNPPQFISPHGWELYDEARKKNDQRAVSYGGPGGLIVWEAERWVVATTPGRFRNQMLCGIQVRIFEDGLLETVARYNFDNRGEPAGVGEYEWHKVFHTKDGSVFPHRNLDLAFQALTENLRPALEYFTKLVEAKAESQQTGNL